MCDYSLHHVATRKAAVGDKLVTASFPMTITHGFAGVDDGVAVCLLPGTEVAFDKNITYADRRKNYLENNYTISEYAVGRFCKVDESNPFAHHDALELPDGEVVLLTLLEDGQKVTVLQLPAQEQPYTVESQTTVEVKETENA